MAALRARTAVAQKAANVCFGSWLPRPELLIGVRLSFDDQLRAIGEQLTGAIEPLFIPGPFGFLR
jgi:hypothetical protein